MSRLFSEAECQAIVGAASGRKVKPNVQSASGRPFRPLPETNDAVPAVTAPAVSGQAGGTLVIAGWLMPSGRFQADKPVGYNDRDRAICALAEPLYRVVA